MFRVSKQQQSHHSSSFTFVNKPLKQQYLNQSINLNLGKSYLSSFLPFNSYRNFSDLNTEKSTTPSFITAENAFQLCKSPKGITKPKNKTRVVVGMSGGVDSSVTAMLMKEQGYDVIGVFMQNWDENNEREQDCTARKDWNDVKRVCDIIGIDAFKIDFIQDYWTEVFEEMLRGYEAGITPNPDILCNREIKFKSFHETAINRFNADIIATGHYARIQRTTNGRYELCTAIDRNKDQTYFLAAITEESLSHTVFPIGNLPKHVVRDYAKAAGLPTADKRDSVGLCFVGKRDFPKFLSQYIDYKQPGQVILYQHNKTEDGDNEAIRKSNLGKADSPAIFYTIGQGARLGGQSRRLFVFRIDADANEIHVCEGNQNPLLYSNHIIARDVTWINGSNPFQHVNSSFNNNSKNDNNNNNNNNNNKNDNNNKDFNHEVRCKIRYRSSSIPATVVIKKENEFYHKFGNNNENMNNENSIKEIAQITLKETARAVTPGQWAVFYDEEEKVCLGGGVISQANKI